jgi:hypothetical protein
MTSRSAAAILLALFAVSSATAQKAQSRPVDRTTLERETNRATYEREYLPRMSALRKDHGGRWLVIAGGVMLPRRGETLAPAKTWQVADAEARKSFPDTRHRFVIRIGDEGDQMMSVGMTQREEIAGRALFRKLGKLIIHPDGVAVRTGRGQVEIGGDGPKEGTWLGLQLGTPGAKPAKLMHKLAAINVFPGHATLKQTTATELDLANWEIPGAVILKPGYGKVPTETVLARCRRAWLHCHCDPLAWSEVVPIAIRPATVRNNKAPSTRRQ